MKKFLTRMLARKWAQGGFDLLHYICLKGMNYGNADSPKASGELFTLKMLRDELPPNPVFFDVGANQGQFAVNVIAIYGKETRLFSFEPSKRAFCELENWALSIESDSIRVFNFGLSSELGTLEMFDDKSSGGGVRGSLYPLDFPHKPMRLGAAGDIEVQVLDAFCESRAIDRIDYLKIDVEGHELEVLKGAARMISERAIGYIQFEFGLANLYSRSFLRDFFEILDGYTIFRILQNGLVELPYSERREVFLTTNYLAKKE